MSYYYINKNPQPYPEDGEHEVHKDGCTSAPLPQNRIEVGYFYNCKDAIKKARELFPLWKIDGCKYCSEECHKI